MSPTYVESVELYFSEENPRSVAQDAAKSSPHKYRHIWTRFITLQPHHNRKQFNLFLKSVWLCVSKPHIAIFVVVSMRWVLRPPAFLYFQCCCYSLGTRCTGFVDPRFTAQLTQVGFTRRWLRVVVFFNVCLASHGFVFVYFFIEVNFSASPQFLYYATFFNARIIITPMHLLSFSRHNYLTTMWLYILLHIFSLYQGTPFLSSGVGSMI